MLGGHSQESTEAREGGSWCVAGHGTDPRLTLVFYTRAIVGHGLFLPGVLGTSDPLFLCRDRLWGESHPFSQPQLWG